MRLGFLVPKDMRQLAFEEVVKWGSENGFDAVDAAVENADICEKYGMEVGSTHLRANVLTPDDEAREKAQTQAMEIIDQAVAKGIKRAMISHRRQPGMSTEESIEVFRKGYGPVAEYAEQYDFKLVMEIWPAWGQWMARSPELFRALFEAVSSPSLGICLDPSHLHMQGIDYIRATKEFGDKICYSHAKDTEILEDKLYEYGVFGQSLGTDRLCTGWWRYRLPGYGEINWPLFLGTLIEVGYNDILAIEHEDEIWYGSPELNKEGLLRAKAVLEPYLF
jgi:sugar phosphate isomerase/epimerase